MGTTDKKYPNRKGLSENFTFFGNLTSYACFKIMGTLVLEYGYSSDLYYLSLLK